MKWSQFVAAGGAHVPNRDQSSSPRPEIQLGRHAKEERMPSWLLKYLSSKDCGVTSHGQIEIISELCNTDDSVKYVYLSDPSVQYVSRSHREGPYFCGYRSIQMLVSYARDTGLSGNQHFEGMPTITDLQELVEKSWDHGISSADRECVGPVYGTRKWVGTAEARTIFKYLQVPCQARVFASDADGCTAWTSLIDAVERYFSSTASFVDGNAKVRQTRLGPIYLQIPGHSMVIVGLEQRQDGSKNIIVFDPGYRPTASMNRAIRSKLTIADQKIVSRLLAPYRRSGAQMESHSNFEMLVIGSPSTGERVEGPLKASTYLK
ncbi:DUF1671-domain-containing protein [Aulographum hederae CBS 113979]|uniref:DUF1671-domain-containing protein n=1 Tax=Aulographum hederae CBS 113979 TaxID=1176131 RepID=A0A6G1GWL2_9PEZI|nr:DUF1671-domain-containing protein [Aulographum hederae CBS 113979]